MAGVVLALLSVGALWRHWAVPRPPAVPLQGADPAVVAVVQNAQDAVRRSPTSGPAWGKLGTILYVHGFDPQAIICFAEAERLDAQEPRWPYLRGLILLSQSDPNKALPDLRRAAALAGDTPDAPRLQLAETLLNLGRPGEAKPLLRQALRHDPNDARALLSLGRLALSQGRVAEARTDLEQSADAAPNVKATTVLLAQTLQQQRDARGAEALARQAATLPDETPWPDPFADEAAQMQVGRVALTHRGELMVIGGQFYDATALMQQATFQYPDAARLWMLLGAGYVGCGDLQDGEKALRKSVALDPRSAETWNHLGNALFRQGHAPEAQTCFTRALALNPQSGEFHVNLGVCLFGLHDTAGAVKQYQTAIGLDPNMVKARGCLADALVQEHQPDAAIVQLQAALRLSPNDPILLRSLAKLRGAVKAP